MTKPRATLRTRLAVLAVATVGLGVARGGVVDPAPFVGNWSMPRDSAIALTCDSSLPLPAAFPADASYPFTVSAGTTSDLVLHVSCHCDLPLNVSGPQATLVGPTACTLIMVDQTLQATVTQVSFDLSTSLPTLTIRGENGEGLARPPYIEGTGICSSFLITGTPSKTSDTPTLCGADATAIGVLPYSPDGTVDCSLRNQVGREAVDIYITTNTDETCPQGTGEHGEGGWVLPQAVRTNLPCNPTKPPDPAKPPKIHLQICRVDGQYFKPLTTDPNATDQFYAVLLLGTECPNGSKLVRQLVDTPDSADASSCVGGPPEAPCGPNRVLNRGSEATTFSLSFCVFRSASSPEGTMAAFPDFGWWYGVFHDFDGAQPSWVMLKRWTYGHQGGGNTLAGPAGWDQTLRTMVDETDDHGLYFEMGRVR